MGLMTKRNVPKLNKLSDDAEVAAIDQQIADLDSDLAKHAGIMADISAQLTAARDLDYRAQAALRGEPIDTSSLRQRHQGSHDAHLVLTRAREILRERRGAAVGRASSRACKERYSEWETLKNEQTQALRNLAEKMLALSDFVDRLEGDGFVACDPIKDARIDLLGHPRDANALINIWIRKAEQL